MIVVVMYEWSCQKSKSPLTAWLTTSFIPQILRISTRLFLEDESLYDWFRHVVFSPASASQHTQGVCVCLCVCVCVCVWETRVRKGKEKPKA